MKRIKIMLQHSLRRCATFVATGIVLMSAASCDEDFDFDNLNTDMTLGGTYTIPVGSTDTLRLERMIELSEKLKVDESGAYALETEGNLDVKADEIESVTVDDLSADPKVIYLSASNAPSSGSGDFFMSEDILDKLRIESSTDIPEEIVSLSVVDIEPIWANLSFRLEFPDQATLQKLQNLRVRGFELKFPKALTFAPGIEGMDYSTNTLRLSRGDFSADGTLDVPVCLSGLKDLPAIVDHVLHVDADVPCSGVLEADVKGGTATEFADFQLVMNFEVPEFEIDKVRGIIDTDIDIAESEVTMGNLPDLLTDENTSIKINTVCVAVDIENPIGIPYDASLLIKALDVNRQEINEAVAVSLPVPAATDYETSSVSHFWVTNSETLQAPEGYTKILVPNLTKLVDRIPQTLRIVPAVDINNGEEHFIQLGKRYEVDATYTVDMPFNFGEGSQVVYRETIDGLQSDLADVADKLSAAEVAAEIYSTVPLQLHVKVTPYDYAGNDLSDALEYTRELTLDPGTESSPSQQKEIVLKEIREGALANLDKIELVIEGNTQGATTVLRPSQYVLVKMKATLSGGVSIDEL